MKKNIINKIAVVVWVTVMSVGCKNLFSDAHTEAHGAHKEHNHEGHHDDHDHDKSEMSDLDRPVEDLFAAACEHNIKTHKCDECRYEVGTVKIDASLFDGGLLKKTKAENKTATQSLKLTGEIGFDERRIAHVSTQVEGIIRSVYVTLGDRVKRGQALMEIDSVAIGEAQADYIESLGMLALAEQNSARVDALRREGIASEKELLAANRELEAAQIRKNAAMGKLKRLGMSSASVQKVSQKSAAGRLVLRAPVDGVVLDMHAVAGEIARADTLLATVGDNTHVWVWADLYEQDIAFITQKQAKQQLKASVEVNAFPGESFAGTVDFISPKMSESSRTLKVRISVPNLNGRLPAGMFARVEVFIPDNRSVLSVNSESVLSDEERHFVFVHYKDEYWIRRPVMPGRTSSKTTEILSGLTGNETIVANGAFLLKSDVLRSKMGAGCAD